MNQPLSRNPYVRLAGACARRPRAVLALSLALACAGAGLAAFRLELRTGRNELFSEEDPALLRFRRFTSRFAGERQLLAVFKVDGDLTRAASAVAQFETEASALVGHELEAVFARSGRERLAISAPYLMPSEDLAALERVLAREAPVLERWSRAQSLEDRLDAITTAVARDAGTLADLGPHRIEPLFELGDRIDGAIAGRAIAPWPAPEPADPLASFHATPDRALVLVHLLPRVDAKDPGSASKIVRAVRACLARVVNAHPGLTAGLTGQEAIDADEMEVSQADMTVASIMAYAGVFVLIAVAYGGLLRPAAVSLVLLVAIGWTFGLAAIYPGHLNLLSIVFALILIGLGVDYGTYVLASYEAARGAGWGVVEAVEVAARASGGAIGAGASTTAVAFYSAMLVDFGGMNQLGFLAGTGVVLSALAMLTALPAAFALLDRRAPGVSPRTTPPPAEPAIVVPAGALPRTAARRWVALVLALTAVGAWQLPRLEFSYNPRRLLAPGLESVEYEALVRAHSKEATWFCVVLAPDREQLAAKLSRLRRLPTVRSTRSILDVRPLPDAEREAAARRIAAFVPPAGDPQRHRAADPASVCRALQSLGDGLLEVSGSLLAARPELAGPLAGLSERLEAAARALSSLDADAARAALSVLDAALVAGIDERLAALAPLGAPRLLAEEELPPVFRALFVARDGNGYAGYVFPTHDISDDRALEELLHDARAIDPELTGLPDMFLAGSRAIRHGFERISLFTLVAVVGILLWTFRSVRASALALVPLIAGVAWTFTFMAMRGWPLDLANCFGVPILLGIGIDVGIHLVHADHARRRDPARWRTTVKAVVVNVATTVLGFAAMLIARHRGLAGLGGFVALGMCAYLVAGLAVLPACLRLWGADRED